MAETPTGVLVAGCPDIDGATKDFGSLGALVRDTQVSIDGVIVVAHAPDGSVAVRQTCGNLGGEGLGWGGGAGLAVGLFAPPLLASAAVGAGVCRRRGCRGRGHRQVRRPRRRAGHPRPF